MTRREIPFQQHCDECAALYAEPDMRPRQNPFDPRKREWTRTRAIQCPWCGQVSFHWEPVGGSFEPYRNPGIPRPLGNGSRLTCGHPICEANEARQCLEESPDYQRAVNRRNEAPAGEGQKPKRGLARIS